MRTGQSDGPASHIGRDLVTINIGEDKTPFEVHKDLLSSSSGYFRAAFEGEFRESLEKCIPLVETTKKQFEDFLDWLYFRRLPSDETVTPEDCAYCGSQCRRPPPNNLDKIANSIFQPFVHISQEDEEDLEECIATNSDGLWQLYVFADRYEFPDLRRRIIDHEYYNGKDNSGYWFAGVVYATRNLPITSPLVRLIIDRQVDGHDPKADDALCGLERLLRQKLSGEYLHAVVDGLCDYKYRKTRAVKNLCAYHEHGQDEKSIQSCLQAQQKSRKRKREELEVEEAGEAEGSDSEG